MRHLKKTLLLACALLLLLQATAFAEAPPVEQPSGWAVWDVEMSYQSGLADISFYTGYRTVVTDAQFGVMHKGLLGKFSVQDTASFGKPSAVTRGEVIKEFYDIVRAALKLEGPSTGEAAVKYFQDNKLVNGRGNKDLALAKACTREELMVFALRTYNYITYALKRESKGVFWKVSDKDNTVYLLGTIHTSDGTAYPLSKDILDAMADAEVTAPEANLLETDPELSAYLDSLVMIEGDKTIKDLISADTYAQYGKAMEASGLPAATYNKFKPWYAALVLNNLDLAGQSYNKMAIDMYVLTMQRDKPIKELEGIRFQMDMFDSFSNELQTALLQDALGSRADTKELLDALFAAWKTGDAAALAKHLSQEESSGDPKLDAQLAEFNHELFTRRDKNMFAKIKAFLTDPGTDDYFVVVGAGHLVTDTGVIAQLKQAGYEVTQVK